MPVNQIRYRSPGGAVISALASKWDVVCSTPSQSIFFADRGLPKLNPESLSPSAGDDDGIDNKFSTTGLRFLFPHRL